MRQQLGHVVTGQSTASGKAPAPYIAAIADSGIRFSSGDMPARAKKANNIARRKNRGGATGLVKQ
jgi:hypothetical protein